jgi:mRNA interferase MazF
MKRGEIWWVNFDPSIGGEIQKQRPAVVVSNDISNKYMNRVQVVPVTSKTDKLYPSEAPVYVVGKHGKAMADQLATVSKERLIKLIGRVSVSELEEIERAIKIQLGL